MDTLRFKIFRDRLRKLFSTRQFGGHPATEVPKDNYPSKPPPRGFGILAGTRWVIALGPLVFGAWVSVDGTDLLVATERFVRFETSGGVDGSTVAFWVLVGVWTIALYWRLRHEDLFEERYRETLIQALYHLPNLSVLWDYPRYHEKVVRIVQEVDVSADRQELGENIQVALAAIAEMARVFAKNEQYAYGANVMLVVNQNDVAHLPAEMTSNIRFVEESIDPTRLDGVLVLVKDLVVEDFDHVDEENPTSARTFPLITLPIRLEPEELVLPGAPQAILNDKLSVYKDTRNLANQYCTAFSAPVRDEIRRYFSADGEGKHVRSFASIRLDSGSDPVGVLNIDTNVPCVLGSDDDYYPTFKALLEPFLHLLSPLVTAYASAWWEEVSTPHPECN